MTTPPETSEETHDAIYPRYELKVFLTNALISLGIGAAAGLILMLSRGIDLKTAAMFSAAAAVGSLLFLNLRYLLKKYSEVVLDTSGITVRKGTRVQQIRWADVKRAGYFGSYGLRWTLTGTSGTRITIYEDGIEDPDWNRLTEEISSQMQALGVKVLYDEYSNPGN